MRQPKASAVAFLSLLVTTACTQPAAQVDMKGHYVFSKNGQQQYQAPAYAYAPKNNQSRNRTYAAPVQHSSQFSGADQSYASGPTNRTASVSSIGVSDLAPPQKDAGVWASKTTQTESVQPWQQHVSAAKESSKWQPTGEDFVTKKTAIVEAQTQKTISKVKGDKVDLITEPRKTSGYIWPVNGNKVLSSYGPKGSGKANDGMNIAAAEGEPVWAVADGEVVFVGDELSGYGNMVLIKHADTKTTTYAHLNQATVDKYDRVKQGDIIGYVGSTGNVKNPQLYFAVRDGKQNIDPKKFLNRSMAGL